MYLGAFLRLARELARRQVGGDAQINRDPWSNRPPEQYGLASKISVHFLMCAVDRYTGVQDESYDKALASIQRVNSIL